MEREPDKQKILPALLSVAALGAAILVGFMLGVIVGDRGRRKPKAEVQTAVVDSLAVDSVVVETLPDTLVVETPEREKPAVSKKEIAAGVEYLATHNRWNRDEMEKFPALQGLWDAVNTYSLDEIRKYNDVLSSTPLITIVECLEQNPKKGYYASRNDHVITLSTYIKRLR